MPGPGKKIKVKKIKSSQPSASESGVLGRPEPFVGDIDNAEHWHIIGEILCTVLSIPDLNTRSGLKKVHADFPNISRRLNELYSRYPRNEKITGGVVGIYAKMCADSILRDKLFEQGFLAKLTPLLNIPHCRHLALRSLSVITHHGGLDARKEIARQTPTLLKVLREHPDNPQVIELATVTMSHAIGAVLYTTETPDPKLLKMLDIRSVIDLTLDNIRKPTTSYYMMNHAVPLLAGPTLHCPKICKSHTSLLKFLSACLRSRDLTTRCAAMGGLIRLHHFEAKPERVFHDPRFLVNSVTRGFPEHITDIMMDYGLPRCDTYGTLAVTRDFQQAMMTVLQDHDLVGLGRKIANLILRTEFSVAEGSFEAEDPKTGKRESFNSGLPFVMWTDSLPVCAHELRQTGRGDDLDYADIIEIKFLIIRQRIANAIVIAKAAIERSPEVAYFYYAISLGADGEDGLRYSKKGLKCKYATPFLKFALLHRAVEHAGSMGVIKVQEASRGDKNWEEGYAFLTSALEDSKDFVRDAPPDSRHLQNILNWYIILTLIYKGPEMSLELHELDDVFRRLDLTSDFAKILGMPIIDTLMRLTRQTVLKHYTVGYKEWADVVARFDSLDCVEPEKLPKDKLDDDLASWLDNLHTDIEEDRPQPCSHPRINPNRVQLYRCSWCSNPSAVLRKCRGCGLTRYCDPSCQKQHWGKHKAACKLASSAN